MTNESGGLVGAVEDGNVRMVEKTRSVVNVFLKRIKTFNCNLLLIDKNYLIKIYHYLCLDLNKLNKKRD